MLKSQIYVGNSRWKKFSLVLCFVLLETGNVHCDCLKGHCTGPQSLIQTECGIRCFSGVRYLSKYYIALTAQTLLFLYQSIWIFTLNEIRL